MRVVEDQFAARLAAVVDDQRDQRTEREVAAHHQQEEFGAADHGRERSREPHQEDQRRCAGGERQRHQEVDRGRDEFFTPHDHASLLQSSNRTLPRRRLFFCERALPSSRRSFEARVGLVAWRFFGATSARRTRSQRRSSASRRFCSWLRSIARHDQQLARVGDALAGERAQARLDVIAQRRIAIQREAQLHGGGDLVDVLPAGSGGADEGHFEIGVRESRARPDDKPIARPSVAGPADRARAGSRARRAAAPGS